MPNSEKPDHAEEEEEKGKEEEVEEEGEEEEEVKKEELTGNLKLPIIKRARKIAKVGYAANSYRKTY